MLASISSLSDFQRSPCKETNNCIMERLSVKIKNCKYLPAYALAVTTNYDLPATLIVEKEATEGYFKLAGMKLMEIRNDH